MVGVLLAVGPRLVHEQPDAPSERIVVGDHEAAFARRDVLALLEAEARHRAHRADQGALAASEICLAAVLDHGHAAFRGEPHDRGHVGGIAEQVGDDDSTVWSLIRDSIDSGVTLPVRGSTSANTGIAPW